MPPMLAPTVDPTQQPDPTKPAPAPAPAPRQFSTLPAAEQQRIRSNISLMQSKGAQPSEIDDYLANHERLAPINAAAPPGRIRSFAAEGTGAAPDQAGRRAAMAAEPPILSSGLPREVEQGATLGFGDEINAGARALFTNQSYNDALANERMIQHAYEAAHPIVSTAAQLAGGAAVGLGASRVLPEAAVGGSRLVRGAKLVAGGAGVGAVAGAGTAEGDLSDRLTGAEHGAIAGAVTAPIVAGLAAGGKRLIGPYVSRAIDASGVRAPAAGAGPILDDKAGVELTLPQKIGRKVGVQSIQDRADNLIGNTLTRDGTTIDDLRAAATQASPDKPVTLADVGGEGAARLVRGARGFTESGAATKVPKIIRGRAESAGARMSEDMTAASGVQPVDPYELADQMRDAQSKQADANYRTAYSKGAVPDETIQDMLKLPYFDDAWKFAKRLAKLDGRQLPERLVSVVEKGSTPPNPNPAMFSDEQWQDFAAKAGAKTPDVTKQVTQQVPDVEALDMVKRGVDKQIENNLAKGSIDKAAAVKLTQRLHEFLGKVDQAVPEYGTARGQYAAAERMREAVDAGKAAVDKDPRLVEREIGKLGTDEEKALYRYGLQDQLNQVIAGTRDGRPIAEKLAGSETSRRQLAAIAKNGPSAQELLKRAGEERTMGRTNDIILGNSSTAENLGARSAIETAAAGGQEPENAASAVRHPIRFLAGRVQAAAAELNPQTADAVANRLLAGTSSRQELLDALDQIDALKKKGQYTKAKARQLLRLPAEGQAGRASSPRKDDLDTYYPNPYQGGQP